MRTKYLKYILLAMMLVILCIAFFVIFMNAVQSRKLKTIVNSISDYYYISCPNGNELSISESDKLKYEYDLAKYSYSLTEHTGCISYRSVTDIWGNTKFYHTGLFSGSSGMNDRTDFPLCVVEINDSVNIQRFFYPTFDENEITTPNSDGGKIYISFEHSLSYEEAVASISEFNKYGTVTWLWVDTYGQSDMTDHPVTIQNPLDGDSLPLYGIPLYHQGLCVAEPLEIFLDILNNAFYDQSKNEICEKLKAVKSGINPSNHQLCENDIEILGAVLLPSGELERKQIFEELNQMDIVKCCT